MIWCIFTVLSDSIFWQFCTLKSNQTISPIPFAHVSLWYSCSDTGMYLCILVAVLCACMHVCVCMYLCMYLYVCVYVSMYVFVCMFVCMCVCLYVCMNVCIRMYTYNYVYVCVVLCIICKKDPRKTPKCQFNVDFLAVPCIQCISEKNSGGHRLWDSWCIRTFCIVFILYYIDLIIMLCFHTICHWKRNMLC
jgi:hypothetical protein